MSESPSLHLGSCCALNDPTQGGPVRMPAHHLVTHAVLTGMTGSGKTGLLIVMLEEALRAGIPCLVVDVKGDLRWGRGRVRRLPRRWS